MKKTHSNPFVVPKGIDAYLKTEEKPEKGTKDTKASARHYMKGTFSSYAKSQIIPIRKISQEAEEELKEKEDDEEIDTVRHHTVIKHPMDTGWRHRNESFRSYWTHKREMFLIQYSQAVKHQTIKKMRDTLSSIEEQLKESEKQLQEDEFSFEHFLEENERTSAQAVEIAEQETRAKLEKITEIRKASSEMMDVKSAISKSEETLKEYLQYKEFLMKLTPAEWKKEQKEKLHAKLGKTVDKDKTETSDIPSNVSSVVSEKKGEEVLKERKSSSKSSSSSSKSSSGSKRSIAVVPEDEKSSTIESDEELEMYFTDPHQLLEVFTELEEQNLNLIQNSEEIEDSLNDIRQREIITREKMTRETDLLKLQIEMLQSAITREDEKIADLELKSMIFSHGEFNPDEQEKTLKQLDKKVTEVYEACFGDLQAKSSTLQMLESIENHLGEMMDRLELIPIEKLETAKKQKKKEYRLRIREEKLRQQVLYHQEKVRHALERANADPKKQQGRKLMFRSEPPSSAHIKKTSDMSADKEDLHYFFT